jgi:two-component system, OmpR family, phosphate regulon sensor histidine kinase PhoR
LTAKLTIGHEQIDHACHQLMRPLAAIVAFAELLADEISGPLNAEQQDQVATVQRNAVRLKALILELRSLAEVALETPPQTRGSGDLERLCGAVQDLWSPQFEERGVRLSLEAAGPVVYDGLDEQRIVGALSRLVENALQASSEGDAVLLRLSSREDEALVEVLDEGSGLRAQSDVEELFAPLRRREKVGAGLGVGLCVARGTIRSMGGEVHIRARAEGGARGIVALPLRAV